MFFVDNTSKDCGSQVHIRRKAGQTHLISVQRSDGVFLLETN